MPGLDDNQAGLCLAMTTEGPFADPFHPLAFTDFRLAGGGARGHICGMTTAAPRLPWQFYLLATLGLALAVGLIFVAFTVALVLLPIVIVVVLWQRWRWQRRVRAAQQQAHRPGARTVVEGDYVVLDQDKR